MEAAGSSEKKMHSRSPLRRANFLFAKRGKKHFDRFRTKAFVVDKRLCPPALRNYSKFKPMALRRPIPIKKANRVCFTNGANCSVLCSGKKQATSMCLFYKFLSHVHKFSIKLLSFKYFEVYNYTREAGKSNKSCLR
jgi:hypothetical protein